MTIAKKTFMLFGLFAATLLATGCSMVEANYTDGKPVVGATVKVYENRKFTGQFGITDMFGRCLLPMKMGKARQEIVLIKGGKQLTKVARPSGNIKLNAGINPANRRQPSRPNNKPNPVNNKNNGNMNGKGAKNPGTGRNMTPKSR